MSLRYNIYPSLLDSFTRYLNCDEAYEHIWGFSDHPSKSLEEWRAEQLQELLDTLNRKPFRSVYADLGTTFNNLVDMYINKTTYQRAYGQELFDYSEPIWATLYKGREYRFPADMVRMVGGLYYGAVSQLFVEGHIDTLFGGVRLYGYLDELMPFAVHDIKVTHRYEPWKFKGNAQHLVYPLCLVQMGVARPTEFDYDILEVRSNAKELQNAPAGDSTPCTVTGWEYHREGYGFDYPTAEAELRKRCEELVVWLEENRPLIDNPRLFGEE